MLSADDHRLTNRSRTFKGGRIHFNYAGTIDCVIRNVSATGACLEIENPVGIPDDFSLWRETETCSCHVMWRKQRRIGVRFI